MSAWLQITNGLLALAGEHAKLLAHQERPWRTATFEGAKHSLTFAFDGAEAVAIGEAFIAELPDHEFTIAGHSVVEAKIVWARSTPAPHLALQVELLVLEDSKETA